MTPAFRHASHLLVALAVILAAPLALLAVAWFQLSPLEHQTLTDILNLHPALIVTAGAFLFGALAFALVWMYRFYVAPLEAIIEELEVIARSNASHRLTPAGSSGLHRLTGGVNALAARIDDLQHTTSRKIQAANELVEREKNTLAMLIQGLTEGIIVISSSGQVLLANARARELTKRGHDEGADLGLGRSIFGFLDRDPVAHAIDDITRRQAEHRDDCSTTFITAGPAGGLLHVALAPVMSGELVQGYLLTLDDITRRTAHESQRDESFRALLHTLRESLTGMRGAVETLEEFPRLEDDRRVQLFHAVQDEISSLTAAMTKASEEHQRHSDVIHPRDTVRMSDILASIALRAGQTLDIQCTVEKSADDPILRLDGFSFIQTIVFVTERVKQTTGVLSFVLRSERLDRFAAIDIVWNGLPLPAATVRGWEGDTVRVAGLSLTETMASVLQRHTAELWSQQGATPGSSMIRVLLPAEPGATEMPKDSVQKVETSGIDDPAGQLYAFDIFEHRDAGSLSDTPLHDIAYTVFDTETTGLQPTAGDEIISIGAVRIVRGTIVRDDVFDRLANPGRKLSAASTSVHGITDDMLEGKPTVEKILPAFRSYCDGSVLVAHNAAFDMRFLQLKEAATGVTFPMPVLDTLLLSTIVHPNLPDHRLETLVKRLGASEAGRHTALGDSLMTAEVFLKLIGLLEARGIRTLGQALEESKKSYHARISY